MKTPLETMISKIKKLELIVNQQLAKFANHNQYDLLPNIIKYIKSNSSPEDKRNRYKILSESERRGLCGGLSSYYLYSKDNNRNKYFFNRLTNIAQHQWNKDELYSNLEMDYMKLVNNVRWLQSPANFGASFNQGVLDKSVEVIRQDDESAIIHEFGIASFFTEEEFVNTFKQCLHTRRMFLLRTSVHAMGLYVEDNTYSFYDPDFKGGCDIIFNNPEDLYIWLIYSSVKYDISKLEANFPSYLELGMEIFRNNQLAPAQYPEPVTLIKNFILNDEQYLQRISNNNMNLLFFNCLNYHPEILDELLKNQTILSMINNPELLLGFTPLIYCCQEGFTDSIKILLEAGANPDTANPKFDTTPLQAAIDYNHLEAVELLIKYGANIYQTTTGGLLPLSRAVTSSSFEIPTLIFMKHKKMGGNVDVKDIYGHTILLNAVEKRNVNLVEFLLKNGANPNYVEMSRGEPLINIASENGDIEIIQLLINHNAKINSSMPHPIFSAASHGQLDTVKYFIDKHKLTSDIINETLQDSLRSHQFNVAIYLMNNYHIAGHGNILMNLLFSTEKQEIYHLIQTSIKLGGDIIRYDKKSNHSLGSWALAKKMPQSNEETTCIKLILAKLDEDPVSRFVVTVTEKTNNLKDKLSHERHVAQTNLATNWFLSNYYLRSGESCAKKINALSEMIFLLSCDPGKSIIEIAEYVETLYPEFLSGLIDHPEKDLVTEIAQSQNELFKHDPFKFYNQ